MGKGKSFVDKLNKASKDFTKHCPQCGESITVVKLVTSEQSQKTEAWRFNQRFVGICKCNQDNLV